nr:MAG TPA: hypothetical protein [Caudoviricetes sp.]
MTVTSSAHIYLHIHCSRFSFRDFPQLEELGLWS